LGGAHHGLCRARRPPDIRLRPGVARLVPIRPDRVRRPRSARRLRHPLRARGNPGGHRAPARRGGALRGRGTPSRQCHHDLGAPAIVADHEGQALGVPGAVRLCTLVAAPLRSTPQSHVQTGGPPGGEQGGIWDLDAHHEARPPALRTVAMHADAGGCRGKWPGPHHARGDAAIGDGNLQAVRWRTKPAALDGKASLGPARRGITGLAGLEAAAEELGRRPGTGPPPWSEGSAASIGGSPEAHLDHPGPAGHSPTSPTSWSPIAARAQRSSSSRRSRPGTRPPSPPSRILPSVGRLVVGPQAGGDVDDRLGGEARHVGGGRPPDQHPPQLLQPLVAHPSRLSAGPGAHLTCPAWARAPPPDYHVVTPSFRSPWWYVRRSTRHATGVGL
jgi:hypothetical protein